MNLILGMPDSYKIYYENNRKDNRKSRSSSKKKNDLKSGIIIKSISASKDNIASNLANSNGSNNNINGNGMNTNLQNMPNNININVNNLIINNPTPNSKSIYITKTLDNIYPNNYGFYLSNSSVFSKLGSDIVNSKMNNNALSNFNKKYPSQVPKLNQGINRGLNNSMVYHTKRLKLIKGIFLLKGLNKKFHNN